MDDIEINFDSKPNAEQAKTSFSSAATADTSSQSKISSGGVPDNDSVLGRLDFRRSSHPVACLFHVAFKALALFV